MAKKSKTALVLGCAGKTGSKVVELLLKEKFDVIGVDNLSTGAYENMPDGKNFVFVPGDVRDLSLFNMMQPLDYVFNCAGIFDEKVAKQNRVGSHFVNVVGAVNILEYCLRVKAKLIIGTDSLFDYEGLVGTQLESVWHLCDQYEKDFGLRYIEIMSDKPGQAAAAMVKYKDEKGAYYDSV